MKGDIKTNAAEFRKSVEAKIGQPYGGVPALGEIEMSKLQAGVILAATVSASRLSDSHETTSTFSPAALSVQIVLSLRPVFCATTDCAAAIIDFVDL